MEMIGGRDCEFERLFATIDGLLGLVSLLLWLQLDIYIHCVHGGVALRIALIERSYMLEQQTSLIQSTFPRLFERLLVFETNGAVGCRLIEQSRSWSQEVVPWLLEARSVGVV